MEDITEPCKLLDRFPASLESVLVKLTRCCLFCCSALTSRVGRVEDTTKPLKRCILSSLSITKLTMFLFLQFFSFKSEFFLYYQNPTATGSTSRKTLFNKKYQGSDKTTFFWVKFTIMCKKHIFDKLSIFVGHWYVKLIIHFALFAKFAILS